MSSGARASTSRATWESGHTNIVIARVFAEQILGRLVVMLCGSVTPSGHFQEKDVLAIIYWPANFLIRSLAKYCPCPSSIAFKIKLATNSGVSPSA
jgi:hypothetical protein